jgi:hypothetical protein
VIQNNNRHFSELQSSRGQESAVAGDDTRFGVDQNRVVESELDDACRDLS